MKAKKHLGQHFLRDKQVIAEIIAHIEQACEGDFPLIEVGPGQGILTFELAKKYKTFRAIEFDRDMVAILLQKIPPTLLINENFLSVDLAEVFEGQSFNLVGNFPYNISSQIVFKMLESRHIIPSMVGMFQKEVAERICAAPGTKKNGIISLRAQAYYNVEKLFDIGPDAFDPPPKVNSSVILLTRKAELEMPCDEKIFNRIIKMTFQQRRKKLRNTLKPFLVDRASELFDKRPEQLGVAEFINIAQLIEKQNKEI